MRPCGWPVLLAALALTAPAAATVTGGSICYKPGLCINGTLFTNNIQVPSFQNMDTVQVLVPNTNTPDPYSLTGAVNLYIVFYNATNARPWTGVAQQQMMDFWTALAGNPAWIKGFQGYPNANQGWGSPVLTSLNVQNPCTTHCYTDGPPGSQGTAWNGSTGGGYCGVLGTDILIVQHAIGAGLPDDPTGIYLVATSDNDMTGTTPGQGWNVGSFVGCTGGALNVPFFVVPSTGGVTDDFNVFGVGTGVMTHEIEEGAFADNHNGYTMQTVNPAPCGNLNQLADVCNQGCGIGIPMLLAGSILPGGSTAGYFESPIGDLVNITYVSASTTHYARLATHFFNSQGGYCDLYEWPVFANIPCQHGWQCPPFSGTCTANPINGNIVSTCFTPNCADGVKNGVEADVDCGVACGNLCASGRHCFTNQDCTSNVCVGACVGAPCAGGTCM